jgi:hypothetical protein
MPSATPDCQLHVLLAPKARVGAILRRGPSKHVALIRWDLTHDRFEVGQWLKGRVYERRCDLSPDGKRLALFVGTWRRGAGTWTALSRPPWFTALAVWPQGDTWGGGGFFEANDRLALSGVLHPLAEGFTLPRGFKVGTFRGEPGEDGPIWRARLERDGWTRVSGSGGPAHGDASVYWRFDPPIVWSRRYPGHTALELRSILHGIKESQGRWYAQDHALLRKNEPVGPDLTRTEWADWDTNGDLLHAKAGRLFRTRIGKGGIPLAPTLLADFRPLKFSAVKAPPEATQWPR